MRRGTRNIRRIFPSTLALSLLVTTQIALAETPGNAPSGDLNGDGLVSVQDLQCMLLIHEQLSLVEPITADLCVSNADCDPGASCRVVFGKHSVCLPTCLSPLVTLGPNPSVVCDSPSINDEDCQGLVHRRNADLNCDGDITDVEFQFLVSMLLGQVGGPGTPDYDSDGQLNFCDPDSDGDGDGDATDCKPLNAAVANGAFELCDGFDNNCNLLVDAEDSGLAAGFCEKQKGVCAGTFIPIWLCIGGEFEPCGALQYIVHNAAYEDGIETLCDNLDNDCDGLTDNDDPDLDSCCNETADCPPTFACDSNNTCVPTGEAGDACATDATCKSGLHCDEAAGICVPDITVGGGCTATGDCEAALICQAGVCLGSGVAGAACAADDHCLTGLHCDEAAGVCVTDWAEGGSCEVASDCAAELKCTAGVCSVALCPEGDDSVDTDGDGVPDACDQCVGDDATGDTDGDGVCNDLDVCLAGDDAADEDGDGAPDACDLCTGNDTTGDTDGDGVCNDGDVCPAGDDALDGDADGVPDACDVCTGDDATGDGDDDGVCDALDLCPSGDDALDADDDGVPDACDACGGDDSAGDTDDDGVCDDLDGCPGGDDALDTDGDTVPDACDLCTGDNTTGDDDEDGVCDDLDGCPDGDDGVDDDGDGVPNACDTCTGDDTTGDDDEDGVCDDLDACAESDDALDADGDAVPDGCDTCTGDDGTGDSDGDTVCNNLDVCPGGDDTVDTDGDGVPDACACTDSDTVMKTLDSDPGDFQTLYAVTPKLGAWHAKRSNVVTKVHIHDAGLGTWKKTTLPYMYYGGAATLSMLKASGDSLFYSHRYPDAGSQGDRVYRYEAGTGTTKVTDLRDVQADPGDLLPDFVAVTPEVAAFHTRRSNVVSRLFRYHRATNAWAAISLPGKSTGGKAVISSIGAQGSLLFYAWAHPQFGTGGDVVHVFDAATKTTKSWETNALVSNPGTLDPSFTVATDELVGIHTKKSNVVSRVMRYRKASAAWSTVDLPGKSTGGKALVSSMAAAGDLLVYTWAHPTFGAGGDIVTAYDATANTTKTWETKALKSNPGSLVPAMVAVTDTLVGFHTKKSNVVSRVMIWNRGLDSWTHIDLPTMYYGGKASLTAIHAGGNMLYLIHPNPTGGSIGDRVWIYNAGADTLTQTDTLDLQADPGGIIPASTDGTSGLFAMHTQRSNVTSRVFIYNACTATWTVDNMPGKSTGGKAVVGTLGAAGGHAYYSFRDPTWPPKGDVVAHRYACSCP